MVLEFLRNRELKRDYIQTGLLAGSAVLQYTRKREYVNDFEQRLERFAEVEKEYADKGYQTIGFGLFQLAAASKNTRGLEIFLGKTPKEGEDVELWGEKILEKHRENIRENF